MTLRKEELKLLDAVIDGVGDKSGYTRCFACKRITHGEDDADCPAHGRDEERGSQ